MTDKQIIIYKKECYNEPHCSLNQVLEQLEAYKMEAEEGKEINAELKAENEELKKKSNIYTCGICGNKEDCNKIYKTLTEIKKIAEKTLWTYSNLDDVTKYNMFDKILQKISEYEVGNDWKK